MKQSYTLYTGNLYNGDIEAEGTNKAVLIATARKVSKPATLIDNITGNILFENKAQRQLNNAQ
jgi:hypothetical protein